MVGGIHTATTESRAATARMSAHDTVWLQTASTWDLMVSITSKPLMELMLGFAVFSPVNVEVSSNSTEPSQPCNRKLRDFSYSEVFKTVEYKI